MDDVVTAEDVVRTAQTVQRDRRELLGLLSDVSSSVVDRKADGTAVVFLSASLFAAIERRANS